VDRLARHEHPHVGPQDRLLTFKEWDTRAGKWAWNDGERYYQQGYSFGLYLRERFGSDTYAKFAHEFAKGWRPDFDTVVQDVLGVSEEQLYNDWVAYLKQKYNAQYDRVKARGEVVGSGRSRVRQAVALHGSRRARRVAHLEVVADPDKDTNKKYKRERRQQRTGTWPSSRARPTTGASRVRGPAGTSSCRAWDERTERAFTGSTTRRTLRSSTRWRTRARRSRR
jgi:hypothetical protein